MRRFVQRILPFAAAFLAAAFLRADMLTDARIEGEAHHSEALRKLQDRVHISVKDGVISLTGSVDTADQKSLAGNAAMLIPNVRRVDNELRVANNQQPQASQVTRPDAWLSFKIRWALLTHHDVSSGATKVSVNDGAVTLSGTAESAAQRDLTAEYVRRIAGVKSVTNNILVNQGLAARPARSTFAGDDVRPGGPARSDTALARAVGSALQHQPATSALHPEISCHSGVVTLRGQADDQDQKDLVSEVVRKIPGVVSLVNDLRVKNQ